jgi:Protein of unknown function (DUF3604)
MPYKAKLLILFIYFLSANVMSSTEGADKKTTSRLFWGDTHLHTSYSPDASLNGNTKIGPEEAFRFARGDAIKGHSGAMAKLKRPLDFLVVADHAEYLGLLPKIRAKDPLVMKNDITRRWGELIASGKEEETWKAMFEVLHDIEVNKPSFSDDSIMRSAWSNVIIAADKYNQPGKFTAFIGYEWTSMPQGNNLHRVVIFKDDASKAGQILPFSSFDSDNPENLWKFLADYEKRTGGEVFAIPHNANMSNGLMFQTTDFSGKPIDRHYAETRIRWEPLVEVTQIKGDGEAHPRLSPEDEFADFENWDKGNLTATATKENWMLKHEYARSALKIGLQVENDTGVNPYKFGMIGSTDAHTGLATAREDNFWGKFSVYEPGLHRLNHHPVVKGKLGKAYDLWSYEISASGYAAVWAEENTRAALFAAMKRKETYATTGPRIRVQTFAGWDFTKEDADDTDFSAIGYAKGVPMGGNLDAASAGKSPTFILKAIKDPDGVNLKRLQVIKGWLDEQGEAHETIYDVATSKSGAVELVTQWMDPDFNPHYKSFYYARVLEIPKPRWTSIDALRLKVELDEQVAVSVQDRAYTSPIWYTP